MSDAVRHPVPTLVHLLTHQSADHPDRVAFRFMTDGDRVDVSWTYGDLDRRARMIGAHLQQVGATGERVLVACLSGLDFVAAVLGCLYAGAVAVPTHPPSQRRFLPRFAAIAADADAVCVLTGADLLTKLASRADLPALTWYATDALAATAADWREPGINPDTLALLQYTSGSTGSPRGVVLTHGNLLANLGAIRQAWWRNQDKLGVFWLPMQHDMGLIGGVLSTLYVAGSSAMFSPAAFLARPMRWLECIARERATISAAPNFAYELCVDKSTPEERAALDLSSWRTAMCGAEPVRAKTLDRFAEAFAPAGFRREAFHPVYGLAESTLLVTGGVTAETPAVRHLPHGTFVGCGRPAVDHDVVIVDPESGEPCQAEQVGEIWASGPSVAHGYWNRPAETTATFQARLADGRGPFLRTGDLGCILDGELVIVGRLKDLIIVRGQNHYPDDIEATVQECHPVLLRHRGAAFAADPDGAGERLVLVQEVDRHGARDADLDDVLGRIRIAVTEAHDVQVAEILLVRPLSVPTTSSGKIRRSACRDRYLGGDLSPVARWTAPEARTPIPEPRFGGSHGAEEITRFLVERIASAVNLSPGEIDQEQPFAYYGLDSARAAQLSAELQAWLGRELPATLPYEYPTIHLLTRHLVGEDTASADPRAARELLVRLPGLSDDAVDRVLRGMLTGGSGPP